MPENTSFDALQSLFITTAVTSRPSCPLQVIVTQIAKKINWRTFSNLSVSNKENLNFGHTEYLSESSGDLKRNVNALKVKFMNMYCISKVQIIVSYIMKFQ